jgi:hypothetical protein
MVLVTYLINWMYERKQKSNRLYVLRIGVNEYTLTNPYPISFCGSFYVEYIMLIINLKFSSVISLT